MTNTSYCRHRWMIVNDFWDKSKHIVKYKCVNCPQEYTQEFDENNHKVEEQSNGKLNQ